MSLWVLHEADTKTILKFSSVMDADLLNETSEGQREEGAGGGSRELPEHSIDLIPVEGEKEGRGLGMKTVVCCAVPEQRFPVNSVLCWSGMVWF